MWPAWCRHASRRSSRSTQLARLAPATGKRKKCKQGGALLACSFCAAVFHNCNECIGDGTLVSEPLVKSSTFPWACPVCFKKGIAAVPSAQSSSRRASGQLAPRPSASGGGRK